jgi:hypothetical protein
MKKSFNALLNSAPPGPIQDPLCAVTCLWFGNVDTIEVYRLLFTGGQRYSAGLARTLFAKQFAGLADSCHALELRVDPA